MLISDRQPERYEQEYIGDVCGVDFSNTWPGKITNLVGLSTVASSVALSFLYFKGSMLVKS
jgi:hypothetical protein